MTALEHYFENLLFHGRDKNGDPNKNSLSPEQQEAVEMCANYILTTIFYGRDEFLQFIKKIK